MKGITIVGGGTAGVLAALHMQKRYGNMATVHMVRSEEIGILGAGEGSTYHLVEFLADLDIPISDLIENTYSTFKIGINFQNWVRDGSSYVHDFSSRFCFNSAVNAESINIIKNNLEFNDYIYGAEIGKQFKAPFIPVNTPIDNYVYNGVKDKEYFEKNYESGAGYSIHFDAANLAKYLEHIASERGIIIVDDKVEEIETDNNNYITALKLEKNGRHATDLVFDCTGFHRLIIGKHYNKKWVSLSEYLPMNRAQPFFLPPSDNPHPWTDAIAQDAGWMWRIPLQHRYGCGYVYDENYITNEEVKESILQQYPDANIPDRIFRFEAGYFEEQFVKNCVSIGLASNFVEPLEATSIFSLLIQLSYLDRFETIPALLHRADRDVDVYLQNVRDEYNDASIDLAISIAQFIQLHYITPREDTPFWKEFKNKKKFSIIEGILQSFEVGNIRNMPITNRQQAFAAANYAMIGHGNELINTSCIPPGEEIDLERIKNRVRAHVDKFVDQADVISMVKRG